MRKIFVFLSVCVLMLGFSTMAGAVPIFQDNFDSESIGLNYTGFANWTVSNGSVDLIGEGSQWDFLPGNGRYVDLDGTTFDAGTLTSLPFTLLGGITYLFEFDLAGSQLGASPNDQVFVNVMLGGYIETLSLGYNQPFNHFTRQLFSETTQPITLSFSAVGGDNMGLLLDNVSVSAVPEPASMLLLGLGLLGIGFVGRRRFRK